MKTIKSLAIAALLCTVISVLNAKRLEAGTTLDMLGDKITSLYDNVCTSSTHLKNVLKDYKECSVDPAIEKARDNIDKAMESVSSHFKRYDAINNPGKYKDEALSKVNYLTDELRAHLEEAHDAVVNAMEEEKNKAQGFFASTKRFFKRIFHRDSHSRLQNLKDSLDKALSTLD